MIFIHKGPTGATETAAEAECCRFCGPRFGRGNKNGEEKLATVTQISEL